MQQLSLFATAAPPTPRPMRPDLPLLLSMSTDHNIGAAQLRQWPQPNEHGCYDKRDAEGIILPNPRKGWRGSNWAEIYLLKLPQGWIFETSVQMPSQGYCGPLSAHCGFSATRAEALAKAGARIANYCKGGSDCKNDNKVADKIRAWAMGLGALC